MNNADSATILANIGNNMSLDIPLQQPSTDIMIEEISRLEDDNFTSEKKMRDIVNLLDHARSLLCMKPDNLEEAASIREDIDQLKATGIAIAQTRQT